MSAPTIGRNTDLAEFLAGPIADRYLPGAEDTLPSAIGPRPVVAELSDDCGTYYMGCPNATEDPHRCPTADEAAPTCGTCPWTWEGSGCDTPTHGGDCPAQHTDYCPAETTQGCPPAETTEGCYDTYSGCTPAETTEGCYDTYSGCPQETTQGCYDTYSGCTPAETTEGCYDTYSGCPDPTSSPAETTDGC
jgi:hypothetical protein